MSVTFKVAIEINLPIRDLFTLFLDKDQFRYWKKDYLGYEQISGTPGQFGAITKLMYKRQTMLEKIVAVNAPVEMIADYEHQQGGKTNMYHTVTNRFISLTPDTTRLEVETEITKIIGVFFKLMITLMAGAGKKYAQTQLNQLKVLAEKK